MICHQPLHSNLVLFKFLSHIILEILTPVFTFQSGSIQIILLVFLIQYTCLYIPIWFYSNIADIFIACVGLTLYIPIWFYSNRHSMLFYLFIIYLYIPIWFYSNLTQASYKSVKSNFTFQSGSIQIATRTTDSDDLTALHSNLVLFKFKCRI